MGDYPMQSEPQGRVVVLEDSAGGGKFDRSHVYADKLAFPTGLMPWKEGVLVAAAPDVLYLPDLDGDLRADERRVILTGFNRYNPQLRSTGSCTASTTGSTAPTPRWDRRGAILNNSD